MGFGGRVRLGKPRRPKRVVVPKAKIVDERLLHPRPNISAAEKRRLLQAEGLSDPGPVVKVPRRGPGGRPGFGGRQDANAIRAGQQRAKAQGKHIGRPKKVLDKA